MHDSTSENPTQSAFDFDALANQPVDDVVLHVNPAPPQKGNYWWSDLEHHRIPKKPGIYAIVNRRNQHFYIGSAKNLKDRKNHHFLDLKAGNHKNDHLQRAYNLYGSNAFLFVIVERVEYFEDLISREQHFIDTLNPHYNIARTAGSCLGTTCSPETKAKMSAARRAHPKMLEQMEKLHADRRGKPLSNEHRAKISVVQVGRSLPDEHKSNISAAHKGKKKTPEHTENIRKAKLGKPRDAATIEKMAASKRGTKHTPETRAKMSASQTGRKHSPESIEKMRAAKLGKKNSPEAKAKMSASRRGKKASPETIEKLRMRKNNLGKKHSLEAKAKMCAAKVGRKQSPEVIAKRVATQKANREKRKAQQQSDQPPLF